MGSAQTPIRPPTCESLDHMVAHEGGPSAQPAPGVCRRSAGTAPEFRGHRQRWRPRITGVSRRLTDPLGMGAAPQRSGAGPEPILTTRDAPGSRPAGALLCHSQPTRVSPYDVPVPEPGPIRSVPPRGCPAPPLEPHEESAGPDGAGRDGWGSARRGARPEPGPHAAGKRRGPARHAGPRDGPRGGLADRRRGRARSDMETLGRASRL